MLVIGTNMAALRAQNAIRVAEAAAQKSMIRISTGKRINSAADDPAGFAVASRMASDILGKQQAVRNTQDGISLAQTADGALASVTDMLQRIRELATASASGTYSADGRADMQVEVTQLVAQIKSVLTLSSFNGIKLFHPTSGGPDPSVSIQTGADSGETKDIGIEGYDLTKLDQISVATAADASATLSLSDYLVNATSTSRARLGATMNALSVSGDGLQNMTAIETEAYDRIMDVDYASEAMQLAKNQLLTNSATAMLVQANDMPGKLVETLLR